MDTSGTPKPHRDPSGGLATAAPDSVGPLGPLGSEPLERVIGSYGDGPGPLLFLLCGMHGNEPAGVLAARRVLAHLAERQPAVRGRLVATTGNLTALERGVRYVDRDLNRVWSWTCLEALQEAGGDSEASEQREIAAVLAEELARHPDDVVVLDLHTTSAHGSPFTIISDTLRNRRVAFALQVPVILGLEENLQGTLLDFLGNYGCSAIGLEGGQHDDPETVGNHEAAIWIALVEAGLIARRDVPALAASVRRLQEASSGQPRVVDILHREEIPEGHDFEMLPGFENFQDVDAGALLAHSGPAATGRREVRCPDDGILIMPRYQGQGSDGFFLGRRIRPFWVHLSGVLRRMKLSRTVAWLPGIAKRAGHGAESDILEVDRRIARWFPADVLHLFGYRRIGADDNRLFFARRVEEAPELDRLQADFRRILGNV